ncbi:GIY-YIG nuclease family protein [Helicobacter valdiviensis]
MPQYLKRLKLNKQYYVYIFFNNSNETLYIGTTNNLIKEFTNTKTN